MEMPFEDINTKIETMPAIGLLSDQTEIFTVSSERLQEVFTTFFQEKKKERFMQKTACLKGCPPSHLWPLTYALPPPPIFISI